MTLKRRSPAHGGASYSGREVPDPIQLAGLAVDRVLEALAGLELGLIGSPDLHRLTGLRIAAHAGFAMGHGKIAKAKNAHLTAPTEAVSDGIEDRIDSIACRRL